MRATMMMMMMMMKETRANSRHRMLINVKTVPRSPRFKAFY